MTTAATSRPAGPPRTRGSRPRLHVAPEPLLRDLIGSALRRVRSASALTLREVAADAGVSLAYLSEIERGRKEPSSEVLAAVCRALGIRVLDLVSDVHAVLDPAPAAAGTSVALAA